MNFDDSAAEAAFRQKARRWLHATAAPHPAESSSGVLSLFEHADPEDERAWVKRCREWQHTKYQGGFGAIAWPREWGGRGGTIMEAVIFEQEEAAFAVDTGAFDITLGMVAPTILTHGTEDQRSHLVPILSGEELWCQLFSEPDAGSDLGALKTTAHQDGGAWRINGQKVWTSGAQSADWGYLLARSDPDAPKHAGITAFMVRMDAPGITIRPLRQMTGGAHFNEVFLDDVQIPDGQRIDAIGSGWRVAMTTLMNERFAAAKFTAVGARLVTGLRHLAAEHGLSGDPVVRQELVRLQVAAGVMRFSNDRVLTSISQGSTPGPEGSLAKLSLVRLLQDAASLAVRLAGPSGVLHDQWSQFVCGVPGMRLGGGTDEVLRNILAERVLGLPR